MAEIFQGAHHPCLGLGGSLAYSAPGGKLAMSWHAADALKQQVRLLDYLQAQQWRPARRIIGGRWMGLCPLHADRKPSFLVDPNKNLFYCYGCGRGGDVLRFAELYYGCLSTNRLRYCAAGKALARCWLSTTSYTRHSYAGIRTQLLA